LPGEDRQVLRWTKNGTVAHAKPLDPKPGLAKGALEGKGLEKGEVDLLAPMHFGGGKPAPAEHPVPNKAMVLVRHRDENRPPSAGSAGIFASTSPGFGTCSSTCHMVMTSKREPPQSRPQN
jgi:hypothetical protein